MNVLAIVLLLALISYTLIRLSWMFRNITGYLYTMASYASLNKISPEEAKKNIGIYPVSTIFLEFNHWDFMRYIKYKEVYYEACIFHVKYMLKSLEKLDNQNSEKTE